MRLALVVNPHAGGGRAMRVLPTHCAALHDDDVVVHLTRDLDDAETAAAQAIHDDRVVVGVGGDGLIGRLAGVVAAADGVLAVLPGGRGNDFARALGVPDEPAAAVDALHAAVERRIDLGDVDGRAYVCIASVGFDSDVQEFALRTRLPLGGQVYAVGALAGAARWRHATFTVTADGVPDTVTGWAVVAANTGVYGGGMNIAPDADPADGCLDVVTTSATGRLRFLRGFGKVYAGTHVDQPEVTVSRARTIRLDADRPFRVFADGDPIGALPATISVRPGALRVLAPVPSG